jgi:predicted PolB exonuclease-like 3'-5' exonuclease
MILNHSITSLSLMMPINRVIFIFALTIVIAVINFHEVQEPHPQPLESKQGGAFDVPHVIRKRYMCVASGVIADPTDIFYI